MPVKGNPSNNHDDNNDASDYTSPCPFTQPCVHFDCEGDGWWTCVLNEDKAARSIILDYDSVSATHFWDYDPLFDYLASIIHFEAINLDLRLITLNFDLKLYPLLQVNDIDVYIALLLTFVDR